MRERVEKKLRLECERVKERETVCKSIRKKKNEKKKEIIEKEAEEKIKVRRIVE